MNFNIRNEYLTIDIIKDGVKVGRCEVDTINKHLCSFEIYEPYQNKGYGQEVLKKLIEEYGIKTLEVKNDNERAMHVYKKFGFDFTEPEYYTMERKG